MQAKLESWLVGLTLTTHCQPLTNNGSIAREADRLGAETYEAILADLKSKVPTGAAAEEQADRTLKKWLEAADVKAAALLQLGCQDPEVERRVTAFRAKVK